MVGNIRIERHPIDVGYLGVFGFDHLHLVFEEEPGGLLNKQDYWPKLEGVREASANGAILGTSGGFPSISLSSSWGLFGDDLIAKIGTPETRGSRIIPFDVEQDAWNEMRAAADEIDNQGLRYIGLAPPFSPQPMMNSSSVIASLLYEVGVDLTFWMPFGVRLSPGATTRIGTTGNDEMLMDKSFTTLVGGKGQDILHGNNNPLQIDKLYGGSDNDLLHWSVGFNVMHGGVPGEDYNGDGIDYVDYSGAGQVIISASDYPLDHWLPQYSAELLTGKDWLFSIERLQWNALTDEVFVRGSATLFKHGILFQLRQDEGEKGDKVDFNEFDDGLLIHRAADGTLFAGSLTPTEDTNGGIWLESVDWIVGSNLDDKIYAETGLRGIEGGDGNDLIDVARIEAFTNESPEGYDIEIYGGDGDDIIVSGTGYTFAEGGDGVDRFILSAMTTSIADGQVEFVISGADSDDRLFTAFNFFDGEDGQYEGSDLLPLLGGIKDYLAIYTSDTDFYLVSSFVWNTSSTTDPYDQRAGVFNFTGQIIYEYEGSDLLVRLSRGQAIKEIVDIPEDNFHEEYWLIQPLFDTETVIRIKDFSEGMLGITFPEQPTESAVNKITNNGQLYAPLEPAPDDAPVAPGASGGSQDPGNPPVDVPGTDGDDAITSIEGPRAVASGAGNDTVETGAFADILDGGTGVDHLTGGGGDDLYYVDEAGDVLVEAAGGGIDSVIASIDYTLAAAVENLALRGNAVTATGNGSSNRLEGNSLANTLTGLGGNDALVGGGGDDVLIDGSGSDAYLYIRGDGSDTIEDIGLASDADVLVLSDQITRADLTLIRLQSSPLDLVIRIADSGYITVKGMLGSAATSLEEIVFTDGTRWLRADILAEAANAPVLDKLPPLAIADSDLVVLSNAAFFDGASLTANDSDTGGGPLTVTAVANASIGTVSVDAAGFITLTTPENYQGYVTFTYTVSDAAGASATAVAELYVLPGTPAPNATPVVTGPGTLAVTEDTALAFAVTATDADGDSLSYQLKLGSEPAKGTVALVAGNGFTYTPNADATGSDNFTIFVSDVRGGSAEQVVTVTIAAVNDAPVATGPATLDVIENTATSGAILATDADGDQLTFTLKSGFEPQKGSVAIGTNGAFTYSPTADATGADTFTIVVSDGNGGMAEQAVSVSIVAVNDQPIAIVDAVTTPEDTAVSLNVIANDTDADGDTITLLSATASNGTVTVSGGSVTYTPNANFNGTDTVTYQIADGNGGSATGTLNVTITPVNDAPVTAAIASLSGTEDTAASGTIAATDVDGDSLTYSVKSGAGPAKGSVSFSANGAYTYTPAVNANGADAFTVVISDANGGIAEQAVAVTFAAVNDAPVATVDAGFETLAGTPVTIQAAALLANDQDIDGDALLIASVGGAVNGTVLLDASGNAVFTANTGYTGAANFTYTVSDGNGGFSTASVALDVRPTTTVITGTTGNNTLTGTNGDDVLDGRGGSDQLFGGTGNDTLIGGPGRDVLSGGAGIDTADYSASTAGVFVFTGNLNGSGGGAGGDATGDSLTGIENITGSAFNDFLLGGSGANVLRGGGGADFLFGGGGGDILDGGTGNDFLGGGRQITDTFIFRGGYGADTVSDFEDRRFAFQTFVAEDILEIDVDGVSSLGDVLVRATQAGGNVVINFGGGDTLTLTSITLDQLGADDFRFV